MLVTMHGHSLVLNLYIRFEQKNIRTHIYIHIFVGHSLQETVKFTRAKITYDGALVSYITYDGPKPTS
jgi:hypothetical protein